MLVKGLVDEDISNYKKTSMFIVTSFCSLKCDKENNNKICQNSRLLQEPSIEIDSESIYQRYIKNHLSSAIVIGGLEPFDTYEDLVDLLSCFRIRHAVKDDIVIYTGYTEQELSNVLVDLKQYFPLIIKFGRFRPNQKPHLDPVLGVDLQNNEQYAKVFKGYFNEPNI